MHSGYPPPIELVWPPVWALHHYIIIFCLFSQNTKSSALRVVQKSVLRRNTYMCGDGQNLTPGDYDRKSERVEMK